MLDAMKRRPLATGVSLVLAALAAPLALPAYAQRDLAPSAPALSERSAVTGVLAAEFALRQGDLAAAADTYFEIAKRGSDTGVAERAVELLVRARRLDDARQIARRWMRMAPDATRPLQIALALALAAKDEPSAREYVVGITALPEAQRPEAVLDAARQLAQYGDRDVAVRLAAVFSERLPKLPESFYALAVASTGTSNARVSEAMLAIERALALRPNWPQAVAVQSRLLLARAANGKEHAAADRAQALAVLTTASAAAPESRELRVLAARTAFDLERYDDARARFLALGNEGKDDADEMNLAAALAAFQAKDWTTAEREFSAALASERGDPSAVRYYLGRIAENEKRWAVAAERYGAVTPGERFWESQLRTAYALAQDKRLLQAMSLLHGLKPGSNAERATLAQTESLIWRESGDDNKAFAALDTALAQDRDNADLLYESAMLAERVNRMDEAELRLRRVIELQPDRAHAYNALGYSLADRNQRLDEARTLIEKAHSLSPDDPAILDSMGWIAYRQGRLGDAEGYLRRAFDRFQDGEIAAHLGEVLWKLERKDEARSIWQTQLKAQPDSDILKKTMTRLESP